MSAAKAFSFDDLPIRLKNLVSIGFPVLGFACVLFSLLSVAEDRRIADRHIRDTVVFSDVLSQMQVRLRGIEADVFARAASNRPLAAGEKPAGHEAVAPYWKQLSGIDGADLAAIGETERLAALLLENLQGLLDPAIQDLTPGARQRLLSHAASLGDQVDQHIERLRSQRTHQLAQGMQAFQARYRKLFLSAVVINAMAVCAGLLLNLFLSLRMTNRLKLMERNVLQMGETSSLISMPAGRDEIGRLGKALMVTAFRLNQKRHDRDLMEDLSLPCLRVDAAGILESANRAARTLLGYTDDELAGRDASTLLLDSQNGLRLFENPEQAAYPVPRTYFRRDGSTVRADCWDSFLHDESGNVVAVCTVLVPLGAGSSTVAEVTARSA